MAEEEVKEGKEGGKKKSIVLFIIIGVVVMLLLIGGILAVVFMSGDDQPPTPIPQSVGKEDTGVGATPSGANRASRSSLLTVGPMYPLDQFIVNLMSQGGRRYLKTTITLEMSDEAMTAEIEKKHAIIRDLIIGVISSKTVEEISTIKGKDKLKDELVSTINEVLTDGYIKNMFFTDFVIQ